MDTKLLMIGDWVIVNSKPTKVEEVDGGSINTTYSYGEIEGYIDEDEISPIPLTTEILEKNGFTFRTPTSMHYDYLFVVFLNEDAEVFTLIGGQQRWLRYIHELQHALRLCGLTDIADNFQV